MRPSTKKRDAEIYDRWQAGEEPKKIQQEMNLTRDEYYKAIAREKKRMEDPEHRRKRAKTGE